MPEKFGANRRALDIRAIDALRNYLKRNGAVESVIRNAVVVV